MAATLEMRDPMHARREPGRIPAIILAVLVHAAFLALLVFGVNWQSRAPEPVQAELWSKLPPIEQAKPPEPAPQPEPPKPEPPKPEPPKPAPPEPVKEPQPTKADIELKHRLEKERVQKEQQKLLEEKSRKEKAEQDRRDAEKREADTKRRREEETKKLAQQKADAAARKAAEEQARAEVSARQVAIDDWANKIRALVRSKANIPDSVTGMPEVQIRIRLLVTGAVFDAQIVKLSGNRVYDEAVERAIAGIRAWPVPSDPALFRDNREVTLNIKHEK